MRYKYDVYKKELKEMKDKTESAIKIQAANKSTKETLDLNTRGSTRPRLPFRIG